MNTAPTTTTPPSSRPDERTRSPRPDLPEHDEASPPRLRNIVEWGAALAMALVLSIGVRAYAVQSYVIPSESMTPTLQVSDRILVEKTPLDLNGVNAGDVVVFHAPKTAPAGTPDVLIKRVITTGGHTVAATGGTVTVDGRPLAEAYTSSPTRDFGPRRIPDGQLFVMGDNRSNSVDSRVFGPISSSDVIGSAFLRTWPLPRVGTVN